ncbi:MAG: helix-turn-helix transcriptional regulator [Candidatus Micrarchaeota archaeon]
MSKKSLHIRIGSRIKKLRKEKKISQEKLAELIDKSVDTVSNIERAIFLPRIETAAEIADALDVDLYELFINDVSAPDKAKMKLLNEILDLLKNQPIDLLKMTLEQVKSFVALKESFINRLKK